MQVSNTAAFVKICLLSITASLFLSCSHSSKDQSWPRPKFSIDWSKLPAFRPLSQSDSIGKRPKEKTGRTPASVAPAVQKALGNVKLNYFYSMLAHEQWLASSLGVDSRLPRVCPQFHHSNVEYLDEISKTKKAYASYQLKRDKSAKVEELRTVFARQHDRVAQELEQLCEYGQTPQLYLVKNFQEYLQTESIPDGEAFEYAMRFPVFYLSFLREIVWGDQLVTSNFALWGKRYLKQSVWERSLQTSVGLQSFSYYTHHLKAKQQRGKVAYLRGSF